MFLLGSVADVRGDARTNLEVLGRIGLTVVEITNAQEWELHFSEISQCELIVDAILGTGFHGQLSGLLETVVADLNGLGVPIVAIDLPTGVSADTPEVEGEAIEASMTVTLAAPKIPLVLPPADSHSGDLVIADIGIPIPVLDDVEAVPRAVPASAARARAARAAIRTREISGGPGDAGSLGRSGAAPWRRLAPSIRSRPRDSGDALVMPPIVARWRRRCMTEGLEETAAGTVDYAALERAARVQGGRHRRRSGLDNHPAPRRSCTPCWSAPESR